MMVISSMRLAGRSLALLCLLLLPLGGCGVQRTTGDGEYRLTILHANDVHSNYGGYTAEGRICYAALCEGGKGGSVRLEQAVSAIRQEDPDAVLLNAGDEFQGSLFWTIHKEAIVARVLNRLEYQAFVPGNHEFDQGTTTFLKLVNALNMPVLAANISFAEPRPGMEKLRPWITLERNGRKIGIIGIANAQTPNLSSPDADTIFEDEAESLRKAVDELSARGGNIIIGLTHIGLENDRKMARSISGLDILVGGHSHSLLSNTLPKAEGPYPVVEKSPEGKPVLVVTAASAGVYLGKLEVAFDAAGVPTAWKGEPLLLDDALLASLQTPGPDKELSTMLDAFAEPVREMLKTPIGAIDAVDRNGKPLEETSVRECREGECLSGNVAADAFLFGPFEDARAVLLNGGSLRASLPGGKVSVGDVVATLPFQDSPVMTDMPGDVLLRALENGVANYGNGEGRFLQVAGLRYAFDARRPSGSRVTKAEVREKGGIWRAVDKTKKYNVVSVDFLARGGDGFSMFPSLPWSQCKMLTSDALRMYLEQYSPVRAKIEGRITILP